MSSGPAYTSGQAADSEKKKITQLALFFGATTANQLAVITMHQNTLKKQPRPSVFLSYIIPTLHSGFIQTAAAGLLNCISAKGPHAYQ